MFSIDFFLQKYIRYLENNKSAASIKEWGSLGSFFSMQHKFLIMIKHSSFVNHSYLSLSHIKRRPQNTLLMICGETLPSVNPCFVTKKEVINYIALPPFMLCHIDEPGSFMHKKVHFSAYRLSTVELHHISSIMICLIVTAGAHTNTDFLSLSSGAVQGTATEHSSAHNSRNPIEARCVDWHVRIRVGTQTWLSKHPHSHNLLTFYVFL